MRYVKYFGFASVVAMVLFSGGAATAADFVYSELSSGYRNCSYDTNGIAQFAVFRVTIDFKGAEGYVGNTGLISRVLMVSTYTGNGEVAQDTVNWGMITAMSGQGSSGYYKSGNSFFLEGLLGLGLQRLHSQA